MDKSKVIYVSGYRSFELGVFKENDPKIQVVKNVLKKELHILDIARQVPLHVSANFWAL